MSIILYGAARVPYTEKVRRALLYKRLAFELHEPTTPEDYQRWNPKSGMLPVIHIGDELIEDSTQILYALDARYPDPPLVASDPMVANLQRQLEDWADESFLWHWMRYRRMLGGGEAPIPLAGEVAPSAEPEKSGPVPPACAPGSRPAAPGNGRSPVCSASSARAWTTW
jgi:glutathione S-transferase